MAQVKYESAASQHWSIAGITEKNPEVNVVDSKHSVLVALFERDLFPELTDFRLIINEGVARDLREFAYEWGHSEPIVSDESLGVRAISKRLEGWLPKHDRSLIELLSLFRIERHSGTTEDLHARLMLELSETLEKRDIAIITSECDSLLWTLYRVVFEAASTPIQKKGNPERITKDAFETFLAREAAHTRERHSHAAMSRPNDSLASQLAALGYPQAYIDQAITLRRSFFLNWRRSTGPNRRSLERAAMDEMRAIYSVERGLAFIEGRSDARALFQQVVRQVSELSTQEQWKASPVTLSDFMGMLFFMMTRESLQFIGES